MKKLSVTRKGSTRLSNLNSLKGLQKIYQRWRQVSVNRPEKEALSAEIIKYLKDPTTLAGVVGSDLFGFAGDPVFEAHGRSEAIIGNTHQRLGEKVLDGSYSSSNAKDKFRRTVTEYLRGLANIQFGHHPKYVDTYRWEVGKKSINEAVKILLSQYESRM